MIGKTAKILILDTNGIHELNLITTQLSCKHLFIQHSHKCMNPPIVALQGAIVLLCCLLFAEELAGGRQGFSRLVLHHVGDLNPSEHKTGAPEAVIQALCDRVNYQMLCNTSIYFWVVHKRRFSFASFLLFALHCRQPPFPACKGIDRCIWAKHSIPRFSFQFPPRKCSPLLIIWF